MNNFLFKLDFEKSYNYIDWELELMDKQDFGPKWKDWIKTVTRIC